MWPWGIGLFKDWVWFDLTRIWSKGDFVWGGTEEDWTEQCLVCVEGGEEGWLEKFSFWGGATQIVADSDWV